MRLFILCICGSLGIVGIALAQNAKSGTGQQLAVGQTFRNVEFPIYQDGQLKATITAAEARGITQNRAETTDLKIKLFENDALTTTITSPKADLYVNERKMRTKNTVLIMRADMEASAQSCEFNVSDKKYMLRTHVRVVLKNFDTNSAASPTGDSPAATPRAPTSEVTPTPPPGAAPAITTDSLPTAVHSSPSTDSK